MPPTAAATLTPFGGPAAGGTGFGANMAAAGFNTTTGISNGRPGAPGAPGGPLGGAVGGPLMNVAAGGLDPMVVSRDVVGAFVAGQVPFLAPLQSNPVHPTDLPVSKQKRLEQLSRRL